MNFTLEQALKAQQALREAANLPEEQFPVQAFIGMLSDEIQALREKGKTDEDIAGIISRATSIELPPSAVGDNYATPEERQRH